MLEHIDAGRQLGEFGSWDGEARLRLYRDKRIADTMGVHVKYGDRDLGRHPIQARLAAEIQ